MKHADVATGMKLDTDVGGVRTLEVIQKASGEVVVRNLQSGKVTAINKVTWDKRYAHATWLHGTPKPQRTSAADARRDNYSVLLGIEAQLIALNNAMQAFLELYRPASLTTSEKPSANSVGPTGYKENT